MRCHGEKNMECVRYNGSYIRNYYVHDIKVFALPQGGFGSGWFYENVAFFQYSVPVFL